MNRFNLPFIGNKSVCFGLLISCSTLLYYPESVMAVSCVGGACENVNTVINANLSLNENVVGKVIESSIIHTGLRTLRFEVNEGPNYAEWFTFPGGGVPAFNTGAPHKNSFFKVDDYISVGVFYKSNCGTEWTAPFNLPVLIQGSCQFAGSYAGGETTWFSREFRAILRIDKPIVSGVYSKNIFLGEYGLCWSGPMASGGSCSFKGATIMRVYVDLNIIAPQTCELNAGQVINIDFGNISSGAFKTAGAIAQGVRPKSRDISVKCDNIAGNAQLTLRLQADKTNGNIVVSDENNDVGFRVTNNSGTPLIPNNLSSVIPFALDSNARQNVTIQAYPVSVTGNKPTEGPVTSRGYLRVDFP